MILAPIAILILIAMTISDNYYSNLEENYPILKETEAIQGKVTNMIVHHKYTYLELDSQTKRLVPPSFLKSPDPTYFCKIVSIGDYFLHEANSNEVVLLKNEEPLSFVVAGFLRSGDL